MSNLLIAHLMLSLIGLVAGIFFLHYLFQSRVPAVLAALFLFTTVATSVSGFMFPITRIGLGQTVGGVSLLVLVPTLLALYVYRLVGPWRWIFAAGAIAVLYLNGVIAVAQAFAKIPVLHAIASTHTAPLFLLAELALLLAFVGMGAHAVGHFHPTAHAVSPGRGPAMLRLQL